VDMPDENIKIRAGYTAIAEILLNKKTDVLTIKEKHLIIENDSTFVELLNEEKKYEKQYVKTGISDGINIEIQKGLDTNDRIKKQ
jgi:HlyD family secretion protein